MNFNEILKSLIEFFSSNNLYLIGLVGFILIVVIGFIGDRRLKLKKLKELKKEDKTAEDVPVYNEIVNEEKTNITVDEPAIKEPEEKDLEPAIEIELPKEEDIKVNSVAISDNIDTMNGEIVVSPEIEEIFKNFIFTEDEQDINEIEKPLEAQSFNEVLQETKEIEKKDEPIKKEEIIEEVLEEPEEILPDKVLGDINPYSTDQEEINNIF